MTTPADFPPRAELVDWGLVPCGGQGCRVLVAPEVAEETGGLCVSCLRATKFDRREQARWSKAARR